MPKDERKKANRRAEYGPARPKSGGGRTPKRQRRKAFRESRKPEVIAARFSRHSVLWFGRHKDKAIRDVPRAYLAWLAGQPKGRSWRLEGLKLFLRRHLEGTF
jgi:uncharacterized protein (DUF3820 family)